MGQCITPFIAKTKDLTKPEVPVPCGKCPECAARRTSGWSFRLMQEDKKSSMSHFITLTYDTQNVPITKAGFMSLDKRGIQLFFKRLRKLNESSGLPIKYYMCGEYGAKTMRPHYHLILFNCKIETIQEAWNLGRVHYGTVSGASVGYTLKYLSKPKRIPMHSNDDREREFSLMSKGLGASYLTPQIVEWHKLDLDNRVYVNLEDGKKASMPRYYKDKIYSENERKRIAFNGAIAQKEKDSQDKRSDHERLQADIAAFRRLKHNSSKGQTI